MSSVLGEKIKLSVFGESHGTAIGCVIDGFPCGIKIDMDMVNAEMARRAPGRDKTTTPRKEADTPEILSGILNGVTTGAPISMIIKNTNTKSGDYGNLMTVPRPSHSDYPAFIKYDGHNDVRGGGHFSGRLTAPVVFAGALAKQALAQKGITIGAHISRIGSVCDKHFDKNNISAEQLEALSKSYFATLDDKEQAMRDEIERARMECDSVGGKIECAVVGMPTGAGGNMFNTIEGRLSYALFGVPAVKGVEFGLGFAFAEAFGSQVNDGYEIQNGEIKTVTNNNGGIAGGMATGAPIVFSAAIKPTPSIAKPQKSVNLQTMENEELVIHGRHDPCIVPRAVPVIEAVCAFTILDILA